jgi:hypothetical protein
MKFKDENKWNNCYKLFSFAARSHVFFKTLKFIEAYECGKCN